jgi:lysophospholipase L1-like esterase
LLALGDSTMQAIGADDPLDGLAGRTADYLEAASGQPVHIANHAVGGATIADILRDQVPHADFARADVVIVSSGNDMERRVAPETYRSNLIKLAEHLPAARTILSDLPVEPGRSRYQPVLAEVADRYGIARADFASAFTSARRPDVFSWLFPHLNSRGYGIWFSAFEPKLDDLLRRATPAN